MEVDHLEIFWNNFSIMTYFFAFLIKNKAINQSAVNFLKVARINTCDRKLFVRSYSTLLQHNP